MKIPGNCDRELEGQGPSTMAEWSEYKEVQHGIGRAKLFCAMEMKVSLFKKVGVLLPSNGLGPM